METILRLSDWEASANPGAGRDEQLQLKAKPEALHPKRTQDFKHELTLPGLDGTNPLAFLAAVGLFRFLTQEAGESVAIAWTDDQGLPCPVLHGDSAALQSEAALLDLLESRLVQDPALHTFSRLLDEPKERFLLRGDTDNSLYEEAILDLEEDEGLNYWLTCNGSDLISSDSNSQLQTARRDYFIGGIKAIIKQTSRSHLERSLFAIWDYADPIEKVTLHLEPREDRRHAYQWNQPSGDPSKKYGGGMVGANRLALEAWPLFQSVATPDGMLQTLGFKGTRSRDTYFKWPLWKYPIGHLELFSLFGLNEIQQNDSTEALQNAKDRGLISVQRLQRILVGKTPNFTPSEAVMC